eukprot:1048767-Karenia_brevis.AAC.1
MTRACHSSPNKTITSTPASIYPRVTWRIARSEGGLRAGRILTLAEAERPEPLASHTELQGT